MPDGSATLRPIRAADLFCGAGGTSTGALRALRDLGREIALTAVNHWPVAIQTHKLNHPGAAHHCTDLEHAKPRELVPGARLDLLMASPTCTFHSRARGGAPVNDQQRMDPWHVVRWCTDLRVDRLLIENVPEFVDWGPCSLVTRRPIPSRKGEYFRAWCEALRSIGFRIDWRTLCCADYGDPTTRQRFFLIGRSDRKPLRWPEPTHARGGSHDMLGTRQPWRPAADIIDWSIPGKSIFRRKRPLAANTLRRILAGAERYGWPAAHCAALRALLDGRAPVLDLSAEAAAPFLIHLRGTSDAHLAAAAHDVDQPLGTLTAGGTHVGLVMATGAGGVARDLTQPLPTITAGGEGGATPHFVQPIIMRGNVGAGRTRDMRGAGEPMPIITCQDSLAVAAPLVAPYYGSGSGQTSKPASHPLDAVTTKARFGLAEPIVFPITHHGDVRVRGASEPLPTVTTAKRGELALAQPALEPDGYRIDILYRMLTWRELAGAMSFDDEGEVYQFAGTATDIVKQIGNAVPGRTAKALVRALMEPGA